MEWYIVLVLWQEVERMVASSPARSPMEGVGSAAALPRLGTVPTRYMPRQTPRQGKS